MNDKPSKLVRGFTCDTCGAQFTDGISAGEHEVDGHRVSHDDVPAELDTYIEAARQLNENIGDSLPATDTITTTADADEVLREFEDHARALRKAKPGHVELPVALGTSSAATIELPIPYGLSARDAAFVLEPTSLDANWDEELDWLKRFCEADEAARIFTAAAMLAHANPTAPFAACLRTAIIWERG